MDRIAEERLQVCIQCEYYDPDGTSEEVVVKGFAGCRACGCSMRLKTFCLSCSCGATELGLPAKWDAYMTQSEEDMFREKSGIKNED